MWGSNYESLYNPEFVKRARAMNAERERQRKIEAIAAREAEKREQLQARIVKLAKRNMILRWRKEDQQRAVNETARPRVTYAHIERLFCRLTGFTREEIRSRRRNRRLVLVKQAIAYWTIRRTSLSYPQVGQMMGKDHTTIIHAVEVYPRRRREMGRYVRPVMSYRAYTNGEMQR